MHSGRNWDLQCQCCVCTFNCSENFFCSNANHQPLEPIFCHNTQICSKTDATTTAFHFVRTFCSNFLFELFVRIFCSNFLFELFVRTLFRACFWRLLAKCNTSKAVPVREVGRVKPGTNGGHFEI
jgi:hypothetical protein